MKKCIWEGWEFKSCMRRDRAPLNRQVLSNIDVLIYDQEMTIHYLVGNAATVTEIAAASHSLARGAGSLASLIGRFRLTPAEAALAARAA